MNYPYLIGNCSMTLVQLYVDIDGSKRYLKPLVDLTN
jgi:hypothetical protein